MISIDAQPFDKSPSHYAPPDVEVENSEKRVASIQRLGRSYDKFKFFKRI